MLKSSLNFYIAFLLILQTEVLAAGMLIDVDTFDVSNAFLWCGSTFIALLGYTEENTVSKLVAIGLISLFVTVSTCLAFLT